MTKQKRDNDYYMQRLKTVSPALYAKVRDGKMSVNKARQLAGLGGSRPPLARLKDAWKKATPAERNSFLSWAGLPGAPAAPLPASSSAFDADGRMLGWARRRIPEIMHRRKLSFGNVADELGVKRLNPSVMNAVRNGTRIKEVGTALAIDHWLARNASV